MPDKSRMPRGIDPFDPYITNTNKYLLEGAPITNGIRLGLLETEITQYTAFATKWNGLYPLYSDKRYTRTKDIRDQLLAIISDTIEFDQKYHILDRIASSANVTVTDMEVFNIKKGPLQKPTHTISTTRLTDVISASIQPLSGGSVAIKCKSNYIPGASILEGADSIQCMYIIGTIPPESADADGLKSYLSTKASFSLNLGSANTAKYLYIYFRWYNTKHPELAAPWSSLYTMLIL